MHINKFLKNSTDGFSLPNGKTTVQMDIEMADKSQAMDREQQYQLYKVTIFIKLNLPKVQAAS